MFSRLSIADDLELKVLAGRLQATKKSPTAEVLKLSFNESGVFFPSRQTGQRERRARHRLILGAHKFLIPPVDFSSECVHLTLERERGSDGVPAIRDESRCEDNGLRTDHRTVRRVRHHKIPRAAQDLGVSVEIYRFSKVGATCKKNGNECQQRQQAFHRSSLQLALRAHLLERIAAIAVWDARRLRGWAQLSVFGFQLSDAFVKVAQHQAAPHELRRGDQ